jgi:hypothetical protein
VSLTRSEKRPSYACGDDYVDVETDVPTWEEYFQRNNVKCSTQEDDEQIGN